MTTKTKKPKKTREQTKSMYEDLFKGLKGLSGQQVVYFKPPTDLDSDTALNRVSMAVRRGVKIRKGYKWGFYNADDGSIAVYLKKDK